MSKRKLAITTSVYQHRTCPFWLRIFVQFLLEPIHSPRPWNVLCVCWDWRGEATAGGIIHKDKNVL